jgi:hypothetical protein
MLLDDVTESDSIKMPTKNVAGAGAEKECAENVSVIVYD